MNKLIYLILLMHIVYIKRFTKYAKKELINKLVEKNTFAVSFLFLIK